MILVSHRERRITIHPRDAAGTWTMRVAIAGGCVAVESVGAALIVDTIYRNSSIPPELGPAGRAPGGEVREHVRAVGPSSRGP